MGKTRTFCVLSGLPIAIDDPAYMLIIRENESRDSWRSHISIFNPCQYWMPVGLPILGTYNGMSWIEPEEADKNRLAMKVLAMYIRRLAAVTAENFQTGDTGFQGDFSALLDESLSDWYVIDQWTNRLPDDDSIAVNYHWRGASPTKTRHGMAWIHPWAMEKAFEKEGSALQLGRRNNYYKFYEQEDPLADLIDQLKRYREIQAEHFKDTSRYDPTKPLDELSLEELMITIRLSISEGDCVGLIEPLRKSWYEWRTMMALVIKKEEPLARDGFNSMMFFIRAMQLLGRMFIPPMNHQADWPSFAAWEKSKLEWLENRIQLECDQYDYDDDDE